MRVINLGPGEAMPFGNMTARFIFFLHYGLSEGDREPWKNHTFQGTGAGDRAGLRLLGIQIVLGRRPPRV